MKNASKLIFNLLKSEGYTPMTTAQIAKHLDLKKPQVTSNLSALRHNEGVVYKAVKMKGGRRVMKQPWEIESINGVEFTKPSDTRHYRRVNGQIVGGVFEGEKFVPKPPKNSKDKREVASPWFNSVPKSTLVDIAAHLNKPLPTLGFGSERYSINGIVDYAKESGRLISKIEDIIGK